MIRILAKSINNVGIMLYSLSLLPLEVLHLGCNEGSAGLILWIIKTPSNYKNYIACHIMAINISCVGSECVLKWAEVGSFLHLKWIAS